MATTAPPPPAPPTGDCPTDPAGTAPARAELSLGELWRILVRWRLLVAGVGAAGLALGIAAALLTRPMFRGTATIEIADAPTQVLPVGQVQPQGGGAQPDNLGTQIGLLGSRSLAERVVRALDLPARADFADPALPRAAREAAATARVQAAFRAEPVRDSRLVRLEFDHPDAALAARVADGYADGFIAANLQRRFEATAYARDFLQGRIAAVKVRLEGSERDLVAYARRHGIVDVATSRAGDVTNSLTTSSLVGLNQALTQAETDRIAAEQRLAQAGAGAARASALNSPVTQGLRTQLADLESQVRANDALFKADYPAMARLRDRIAALRASLSAEGEATAAATSGTLLGDYRAALAREREVRREVEALKRAALDLRDRSIRYTILQREVDTNRVLYDALLGRFKEVSVAGGLGENLVSVVDRAQVPAAPVSPRPLLDAGVGLALGLLAGVGAALAREIVGDAVETADDVEERLGLRTLGAVPRFRRRDDLLQLLSEPRSPIAEAYQSVAGALRFATAGGTPRTLLVTSPGPGEGKSTSALGIARALAGTGRSVLLIDADLRKPTFKVTAGKPGEREATGLSNLLAGDADLGEAIHLVRFHGLALMPSGPVPPSPAELLGTDRFAAVLAHLRDRFDVVVVDGPPVLGLADAPLMAAGVAGVVLVLEAGAVRGRGARAVVARLRGSRGAVVGAVLTKVAERRGGYGYGAEYGYGYGYGDGGRQSRGGGTELRLPASDAVDA